MGTQNGGMHNQDWVIARLREDVARENPARWSVREQEGRRQVWMSVLGNEGWYQPVVEGGRVVYLQSEALEVGGGKWLARYLSGKVERKIVEVMA